MIYIYIIRLAWSAIQFPAWALGILDKRRVSSRDRDYRSIFSATVVRSTLVYVLTFDIWFLLTCSKSSGYIFFYMALSSSPRKLVVPLASGDEPRSRNLSVVPSITKRVFYCGVVVEGSENGRRLPEGTCHLLAKWQDIDFNSEIQELVLSFGDPFSSEPSTDILASTPTPSLTEIVSPPLGSL